MCLFFCLFVCWVVCLFFCLFVCWVVCLFWFCFGFLRFWSKRVFCICFWVSDQTVQIICHPKTTYLGNFDRKWQICSKIRFFSSNFHPNFSSSSEPLQVPKENFSEMFPGDTHMLRHTGMCRPNGLLFHQKSLDMGPILVRQILRGGSHFNKVHTISRFWGRKILRNGS